MVTRTLESQGLTRADREQFVVGTKMMARTYISRAVSFSPEMLADVEIQASKPPFHGNFSAFVANAVAAELLRIEERTGERKFLAALKEYIRTHVRSPKSKKPAARKPRAKAKKPSSKAVKRRRKSR